MLPHHEGPPARVPAPLLCSPAGSIGASFAIIDYLKVENRILREHLQGRGCGSPMTSGNAWRFAVKRSGDECCATLPAC
jgi:hypothetical protein